MMSIFTGALTAISRGRIERNLGRIIAAGYMVAGGVACLIDSAFTMPVEAFGLPLIIVCLMRDASQPDDPTSVF